MNTKELGIIRNTAAGFRRALNELSGDGGDAALAAAINDLHEHLDRPLSSELAGYYAAMFLAWQEHGCPDLTT